LQKEAKYWAFKQGLAEGTPECKEYINQFIRDYSEKLSEDKKSTIKSLLNES
jgi:succinate dehydrogenase flavin-adding protein (antitoxin of CptAB toxin-antitoxin module)